MKNEIKFQLKSAFASPGFLRIILLGVIYAIGCFLITCSIAYDDDFISVPGAFNLFFFNATNDPQALIFKMIFPFIACAAFADSYLSDYSRNYIPVCITRTNAKKYYFSKMTAVFAAGAFVIMLPQIINYLLCLTAFPLNGTIENTLELYQSELYTIRLAEILFKKLFILSPYFYYLLYIFISGFAGGIIAIISYQISFFIHNRILALTFMFIATNLFSVLCTTYDLPLDILLSILGNEIPTPSYFYFFLIMFVYIAMAALPIPFALKRVKNNI